MAEFPKVKRFIEKHPYISFLVTFAFITLPQYIESIWSLFTDKPLVPTVYKWFGSARLPEVSMSWLNIITIPIGIIMFLIIFRSQKKQNKPPIKFEYTVKEKPSNYPIKIEFENANEFLFQGEDYGEGLNAYQLWIYRIKLENTTSKSIKEVQVDLIKITDEKTNKIPSEFQGNTPYSLPFSDGSTIRTINGYLSAPVDVYCFKSGYWAQYMYLGSKDGNSVFGMNNPYIIEIAVSSPEIEGIAKEKFKIGIKTFEDGHNEPYMYPLGSDDLTIKINYIENHSKYFHEGRGTDHHVICIENMTDRTIEDASIEITDMKPLHAVFKRQIPLFIKKSINLNPGNNFFTIIQWIYTYQPEFYEFITKHSTIGTRFSVDDNGHEIELTVRGKNLLPVSKRYKFGIQRIHAKKDKFWFRKVN